MSFKHPFFYFVPLCLCAFVPHVIAQDWQVSFTYLPGASVDYAGDGKNFPPSYTVNYEGLSEPLYRLALVQAIDEDRAWEFSLMHTGVFGGGKHATELIGDYQRNKLNIGLTNLFVSYRHRLAGTDIHGIINTSVVREIFKRESFFIKPSGGVLTLIPGLEDTNEISAEGIGFGLEGKHGSNRYVRWRTDANYYVQLFDSKTDSEAGQIFTIETGIGQKFKKFEVELGGLWLYWFTHGQTNRRLHASLAGTEGAIISWANIQTYISGGYLKITTNF